MNIKKVDNLSSDPTKYVITPEFMNGFNTAKSLLKGVGEMKTCNHGCGSKKSCANYRNIKCIRCKHYGGGTFWKCYFKKPIKISKIRVENDRQRRERVE